MLKNRQYTIFFISFGFLIILLIRLFFLQIVNFASYREMAAEQHNQVIKIEPIRGTITDRFLEPLAVNIEVLSVCADPRSMSDKVKAAEELSKVLSVDREFLIERFSKDKSFVWVKRKVQPLEAEKVKTLDIDGIFFVKESKRTYPNETLASHVIGFAGMDNNGLEGLELLYDMKLKGEPGYKHCVRDARARLVLDDEQNSIPPKNGYNIVLTLDSVIQYIAEEEMKATAIKYNAAFATAIVMNPYTGEILALANYPGYDPNKFSDIPKSLMKNSAVSYVFEPGSVFKIVTASAVLNEGAVKPTDVFDCENGQYSIAGRILHDYHPYGNLDYKSVISKSSNIGTVKSAQEIGDKKFYEYVKNFGFGEKTNVDLPGELPGLSRPTEVWAKSDMTTIPIGQGIAVTGMQLVCGISVIANGGNLVQPYIVDRITTPEGEVVLQNKPVIKRKVLDKETSDTMKDILHEVTVSGTGKSAAVKNYETCGKTGTAQMVNPNGWYYTNKYYASFIGFVPRDKPLIAIVVTVADPHNGHFGGTVAGPAFKNIAAKALEYIESNSTRKADLGGLKGANTTVKAGGKNGVQ